MKVLDFALTIGIGVIPIILYLIHFGIKDYKEEKKLKETPIEVHSYKFNIHLDNGDIYESYSDYFVTYSFNDFVEWDIFSDETYKVFDKLVVSTGHITKVDCICKVSYKIKPILNYCGHNKVYTAKEVNDRKIGEYIENE